MAYTKTKWVDGDNITADKLNNLEEGSIDFTKPLPVSITGNSASATKLLNPRTINGVAFDGTANINVKSLTFLTTDVSNVTQSGFYYATGDGLPSANGFYVTVISQTSKVFYQYAIRDFDFKKFERMSDSNGNYSDWLEVQTKGEKGEKGDRGDTGQSYSPNINPRLDRFANNFHLNNPISTSMNDIQTGFYDGEKWHLYYLYNADIAWGGNGTEWYHVTTTDWVKYKNEGVAVHKYQTGYGDIATGTMWEDNTNVVGKGVGTKFAMATGYGGANGQNTMLYYSTDGGYQYQPYQAEPVLRHAEGEEDFRDPFLFYMDGKFICYMAENNKFGVYVSDKINEGYVYKGAYVAPHPLLECPNLFVMDVNGDPNNKKWVCIYSGNGGDDMQTGMYASVGHLDSNYVFQPEQEDIRIDWGPDFYAAKPFADTTTGDVNSSVLIVGWLGSWGYVGNVPRESRNGVGASTCRRIKLEYTGGKYDIKSDILGVNNYLENPVQGSNLKGNSELPMFKGDSFYLKLRFKDMLSYKGNVSIKFTGNGYDTTFTFYLDNQNASVHRFNSQFTNNEIFNRDHVFPVKTSDFSDLWLEFYVDRTVIEMKTPDRKTYTMTKFPVGPSRESINVGSSSDCNFDYEYYQVSNDGNIV